MTREHILTLYKVRKSDGLISSPGAFEGEPIYVPYFWDVGARRRRRRR
jgi:hypothetical protein